MNQQSDQPAAGLTLDQLVEEFVHNLRAGSADSIDTYCEKYPQLAEEIAQLFPSLEMLENCRPNSEDASPRLFDAEDIPPEVLADYRIVREIGRGGMGIVYEAEHETMQRRVALKVLPKSIAQQETHVARFHQEARSAGQIHHTNVVPVFAVGEDRGFHFYAMQYIRGQNLDLVIKELRELRNSEPRAASQKTVRQGSTQTDPELSQTLAYQMIRGGELDSPGPSDATVDTDRVTSQLESTQVSRENVFDSSSWGQQANEHHDYFRRVASLGYQVADALAHAHSNNLLHRDIKPSNLILDTDGVVWVTDFGLAKGPDDDLTKTGDIVGTLRYMSPERFEGTTDHRSDIYSLGLTLYELCTLENAFESSDRAQLVQQVAERSPVAPAQDRRANSP